MRTAAKLTSPFCRLLGAATLVLASAAAAGSELDRFLDGVDSLSGRFEQRQFDEDGEVLARSTGAFWIRRPDRFRWAYETPYEQLVVSDGRTIWIHDPDLEQVTRRSADAALSGTPAALLSRDRAAMEAFEIEALGETDGLSGWRLVPRSGEGDFRDMTLWLDDAVPRRLAFTDQLGGTTRIELLDAVRDAEIPAQRFEFVPPPGAEVVDG